uniref:DUF2185 domain-containing protein n=1 Tax=Steinernema glaseri TaxID=37863 RepID=A0A1I7Y8L5_9BILA
MKLTKLDVLKTRCPLFGYSDVLKAAVFIIKYGWLYYPYEEEDESVGIRMLNLSTGEEREFEIDGFQGNPQALFCVNDRIHILYWDEIKESYYVISEWAQRILRRELIPQAANCTLENIADSVDNFTDVKFVHSFVQEGEVIYIHGVDKNFHNVLWKLEEPSVDSEAHTSPWSALTPLEGVAYCSSMDQGSFLCLTCGTLKKKDDCVYCRTCSDAQNKSVLVCAMCVIRAHKDHDYEPAFPDRDDKEKFLKEIITSKIDIDEELDLLEERFHFELINVITEKLEMLEYTVDCIETKINNVIENKNITTADLENEVANLRELATRGEFEKKAFEEWKETVLAAIRS